MHHISVQPGPPSKSTSSMEASTGDLALRYPNGHCCLLRPGHHRPRRRAAERCDERPAAVAHVHAFDEGVVKGAAALDHSSAHGAECMCSWAACHTGWSPGLATIVHSVGVVTFIRGRGPGSEDRMPRIGARLIGVSLLFGLTAPFASAAETLQNIPVPHEGLRDDRPSRDERPFDCLKTGAPYSTAFKAR
jgi:hypothetical protein